jgi:hypothetical protein
LELLSVFDVLDNANANTKMTNKDLVYQKGSVISGILAQQSTASVTASPFLH